jgi:hypothetical protein
MALQPETVNSAAAAPRTPIAITDPTSLRLDDPPDVRMLWTPQRAEASSLLNCSRERIMSRRLTVVSLVLVAAPAMLQPACEESSDPVWANSGAGGASQDGGAGSAAMGGMGGAAGQAGSAGHGGSAGTSAGAGHAGSTDAGTADVPEAGSAGDGSDASVDHTPDVDFGYDAPTHDTSLNQDSACANTSVAAESTPLDLYLMLDSTGTMGTDCNVGQTVLSKWCRSINALAGYIQDSSSAGNRAALQFFSSTVSATCDGAFYASPRVALDYLPANAPSLIAALDAQKPGGTTPTEGALRGLASFTTAYKTAGRAMIGILVTDGDPTACITSASNLGTIVADHYSKTQIPIYVIGMTGAIFANLESIAAGGGAPVHSDYCGGAAWCHYYSVGDGDPQPFIQLLKQIQHTALACSFKMPKADAGLVDPNKVIVQYSPYGTGTPRPLDRVDDSSQCAGNGWYYDSLTNPTAILLCPSTCTTVQDDPDAKIDILLGCLGS